MDIACLELETEGRGLFIEKMLIYGQRTIHACKHLEEDVKQYIFTKI
jgi:hypothetical protein